MRPLPLTFLFYFCIIYQFLNRLKDKPFVGRELSDFKGCNDTIVCHYRLKIPDGRAAIHMVQVITLANMEATMNKTDFPQSDLNSTKSANGWKFLVRFSWLLVGNVILFFLASSIVVNKAGITSDYAYWITVVALIGIRLLDIKKFAGETADFEPATMVHWRKYTIKLILLALLVYILAKGLAYLNLF